MYHVKLFLIMELENMCPNIKLYFIPNANITKSFKYSTENGQKQYMILKNLIYFMIILLMLICELFKMCMGDTSLHFQKEPKVRMLLYNLYGIYT